MARATHRLGMHYEVSGVLITTLCIQARDILTSREDLFMQKVKRGVNMSVMSMHFEYFRVFTINAQKPQRYKGCFLVWTLYIMLCTIQ